MIVGKIDLVLTKSISRFAGNTKDCIEALRELKKLNIAVRFEKEGIDTSKDSGEMIITMLLQTSSYAATVVHHTGGSHGQDRATRKKGL